MTVLAITRLKRDTGTQVRIKKLVEDLFLKENGSVDPLYLEFSVMVEDNSQTGIQGLRIYLFKEMTDIEDATNLFTEDEFNNYFHGVGGWESRVKEGSKFLKILNEEEEWMEFKISQITRFERSEINDNVFSYDVFFKEELSPGERAVFRIKLKYPKFAVRGGLVLEKKLSVETRFYDRHLAQQYGIAISGHELIPIDKLYVWLVSPWKWSIIPESIVPHDSAIFMLRSLEKSNPYNEKGGYQRKVLKWCWKEGLSRWHTAFCASIEVKWEAPNWATFGLGVVVGALESIALKKFLEFLSAHSILP